MDDEGVTMKKMVFVDESGNPGIKDEQGEFVIVGIIVVNENDLVRISKEFSKIRRQMNLDRDFEFKFSKTNKKIIIKLLEGLSDIEGRS